MSAEEVPMTYPGAAVERAMKVQDVILCALSGRQSWLQVADILGVSPRTVRRLRWRYERYPSPSRAEDPSRSRRRRVRPARLALGREDRLQ